MEKSLFIQWVQKFFPGIIVRTVQTLNDTKRPQVYLHQTMLKPVFSLTGKWESLSASFSLVAANLVAMDSSIPVIMRDSIAQASGDIPKQAIELSLNESELTALDTLIATGATNGQIIAKLFADTPKAIGAIYERNEIIFLQGLSTGVALVDDPENNTGIGVRCDYRYKTENKFGVSVLWTNPATSTPLADIRRVIEKAIEDGVEITKVLIDTPTATLISKSNEVKDQYTFNADNSASNSTIRNLSFKKLNELMMEEFGFIFEKVDRTVRVEKNAKRTKIKPFASGALVFVANQIVGELVYAKLAEENHKEAGVEYQKANEYILVSKFRTTTPSLKEVTRAQARVVPIVTAIDEVYLLDSTQIQA